MNAFKELRRATLEARQRTGDPHVGVDVTGGRFSVVRAIPPQSGKGAYTIDWLKPDLSIEDAIKHLDSMGGKSA